MKPRGIATEVIYEPQEKKLELEEVKPKYPGTAFQVGKEKRNARDIMGSIEYRDDQKCQRKKQKEQCIAPCVWNESQEPQCRYENVIQKISEVTANIAVDNDAFTSLEVIWIKDENFIEKKKKLKIARKSLLLSLDENSGNMFDKPKIEKQISDNILSDLTLKMPPAASLYSSPKSSVAAASPKSSPKSAAASPKSSSKSAAATAASLEYKDPASFHNGQAISTGFPIGNTRQSVSVATTSLLASAYSWFESGVDFFTRVREEKELSAEELEKLEKKEYDFYKQNIEWLYSDSIEIDRENAAAEAKKEKEIKEKMEEIAALQKKIEKEKRDKKEKEDADRAEKEKEIKDKIAALQKKIEKDKKEKEDADRAEKEKEIKEKMEEIAALQKKKEKEERDKKEKEDAARAEKDAARAAAKAEEDAVRAEEDAKYTAARNERLKYIATSAWSTIGTMVAGAVDLTKGVINVGKEVGKEGIKVGKEVGKVGKKVGKYGIGMAFDGLNNLLKTLDENNKRTARDAAAKDAAAKKPAKDAAAKKPAKEPARKVYMGESNQNHQTADSGDYGDSGDEVVFIGRNPKREATATLTRIPSAAAYPPSFPQASPTCEDIMDEEPCETSQIGTYGCNWMDGRMPLCLQSQANKNNERIQQIFNQSNNESWSEAEVANYINNPTSQIYQFWRRGRKALITRWAKERHFGDNFMGTKATTNKRGHRTKGGNRKTKKRNNKRK